MATDALPLRIRTKKGVKPVEGLTRASTVLDLKQKLSPLMEGLAANCMAVKYGFPPKKLQAAFSDALGDVGLMPGDVLVVEETEPQEIPLSDNEMHSLRDNGIAFPPLPVGRPPRVGRELGQLVRRPVAADNSCLFTSLAQALFQEQSLAPSLRRICAAGVVADEELTEAMLEKPREAYCAWIMLPSAWGGSIELVLLSKHFHISIAVCDIRSQRIFQYGPGRRLSHCLAWLLWTLQSKISPPDSLHLNNLPQCAH